MTQAIREGRLSVDDLSGSLDDYATTVEDTFNDNIGSARTKQKSHLII